MTPSVPPFYQPSNSKGLPPTPRPFHMSEPFMERGIWSFWLAADDHILDYVRHLYCVLTTSMTPSLLQRRQNGRLLVYLNPRYDHQEAWLWIYEILEHETRPVELGAVWESAIDIACTAHEDNQDGWWGE